MESAASARTTGGTDTAERILDATVEAVSLFGIAKLSMSDVASRAGISRPTLYKYFASKEQLVADTVAREAMILVGRVLEATAEQPDVTDALRTAIATALVLTREHPLLDRIIRTEPESLLPYLTTERVAGEGTENGSPVLTFLRSAAESIIAARLGDRLDELTRRRVADMIGRLLLSYAITAPDDPPEVVADVIADVVVNGVLASAEAAE